MLRLLHTISLMSTSSSTALFLEPRASSITNIHNKLRASFLFTTFSKTPKSRLPMFNSLSEENLPCIEVEQKFSTANLDEVQSKLLQMKFEPKGSNVQFMDWYFDSPDLQLCTKDCWLRFRHPTNAPQKGSWQLKRGKTSNGLDFTGSSGSSTVYEELEDDDALDLAESMLKESTVQEKTSEGSEQCEKLNGFLVPDLSRLREYRMEPIARIETIRSSWASSNLNSDPVYQGITIDLDGTDYGYTVGEVEIVVQSNDEVEEARGRVKLVIEEICGNNSSRALGKLETYLIENRPEVYEACVKAGSMSSQE